MADVKSGDVVVPGDQLCVIEELMPGLGTYEQDGVVYAATSGGVAIDLKDRSIRIVDGDGRLKLSLPVRGDIVMGEVTNAWEQRAEVTVVKMNDEDVLSPFIGEIHISNVTRRFVKSMSDVLQKGDIVRALVMTTHKLPAELSLVGPELGVVDAVCVRCGNELTLTTYNNLVCLRCENRATREVAKDYGVMFGIETRQDLAPRRRSYDDRRRDHRDGPRDRGGGRPFRRFDDRRDGRGRGRRDEDRRRH